MNSKYITTMGNIMKKSRKNNSTFYLVAAKNRSRVAMSELDLALVPSLMFPAEIFLN